MFTSSTTPADLPARRLCTACARPASTCICRWIDAVPLDASLLILQHPLEVKHAKGSARLLHLCIPGSVLLTGETFDPALLAAHLHAGGRTPRLLYPDAVDAHAAANADANADANHAAVRLPATEVRLVVLDGTWRKSRKMLHLNPLLASLPRLALRAMPPSHYRIRKAHGPDQLSSFEAAAHALTGLPGQGDCAARLGRLLAAFDGFVEQQAGYVAARQAP